MMRRHQHPSLRALVVLLVGLGLLLTACSSGGAQPSLAPKKTPATPGSSVPARGDFIAQATVPMLQVYDAPGAPMPSREFENPWYYTSDYQKQYPIDSVFFSDDQKPGWVKVLLPVRPNGSTGWVRASDVRLFASRYRIEVDLSDHRLTVWEGGNVFLEDTVAIGKDSTPTPVGRFYLRVLLKAPDPNEVYGPYAYGLSGYSETLEQFNGSDAQVGIHGNNDPSQLGRGASSGCIRMSNEAITRLAAILPLGTIVDVHE
ncbi:MAG: L,D-transpeptidase [Actinomycetota bacterium]